MSARIRVKTIVVVGLVLVLPVCARAAVIEKQAPDILLIMPDQMRGDCLSAVGHPVVRTPNLDKLARGGVLFRCGYSSVPSCIPARYALLTGLSPQRSGVVGFASRKIDTPTLPETLGNAGYVTLLVGRTMHQDPPNKSVGYQREILGSTYVPGDAYDRYLRQAAPQSGGIQKLVGDAGLSFNFWEAKPWPLADELHPTSWAIRQAEQAIAAAPAGKPLFLTASFYSPHPPLFAPRKYFNAMLERGLPQPAHGDWVDWSKLTPQGSPQRDRVLLQGEPLRQAQAGYFGLIEQLDAEIAPLIAAFKARSEKAGRPWVIVFTSDHGEMLGDHGYFRKCEPYEGSANIPFIIAGSETMRFKPGVRKRQPVALHDLMPTLLALAGAKAPAGMDGVNLLPALRDAGQPVRDFLHFEHANCYTRQQAFHALTDGRFKYVWRPLDGTEQLFDLDNDPREEHNLAKDPALPAWRQRLVARLAGRPEGFTDGSSLIAGRPYPPIMRNKR
jgi:arylsulfatase A-like enzyme